MTDIRQSKYYARYMESLGWTVEKAGATNIFIRPMPIVNFLSVIKVQRFKDIDFKILEQITKKYHPILTKLEPRTQYRVPSIFRHDSWPLSPTKTLILDIMNIHLPKDTNYEIRKAVSNKLVIRQSEDVNLFYILLQETMKIGHWSLPIKKEVTSLYKSFQPDNSQILLTYTERSQPLAGCLLIWEGDMAHYMYAANTKLGRELGGAYFTLWEAIKFCQKKKLKYLDLEGIYDDRFPGSTKNWQGFTKFKMGWGGKVVDYPGSFTKYF